MVQVARETGLPEGTATSFTGRLFQPVPWSPNTRLGMPKELEQFHADPDYVFINVPPNFMLKVRILLCSHHTLHVLLSYTAVSQRSSEIGVLFLAAQAKIFKPSRLCAVYQKVQ
jgi:hypothetical protein